MILRQYSLFLLYSFEADIRIKPKVYVCAGSGVVSGKIRHNLNKNIKL